MQVSRKNKNMNKAFKSSKSSKKNIIKKKKTHKNMLNMRGGVLTKEEAENHERNSRIEYIENIISYKDVEISTPKLNIDNPKTIVSIKYLEINPLNKDLRYTIYGELLNKTTNEWYVLGTGELGVVFTFDAYKNNMWVMGDLNDTIYASSEDAYIDFIANVTITTYNPLDS